MTTNSNIDISIGGISSIPIIAAIVTIAITHDIYVGATMFVVAFAYGLTTLIGAIPVVGVILQYMFINNTMNPWLLATFSLPLETMWIVNIVFWIAIIGGFISTIVTTSILAAFIYNRTR